MSRFEKVWLPEGANDPSKRFSVTFGRHYNACSRSGYLYEVYRGQDRSHPMERGSAFHRIRELGTQLAIEKNEMAVPPEVVKAIAAEVFADPAYRCAFEEQDYVREMAYRWAEQEVIDPGAVIANETLFVLDVDGVEIRAKIDRADLLEHGAVVRIRDDKTSRSMPSYEDIGRKRPDGSIAAKDYQLVLYGLAVAFGVPIRIERCPTCNFDSDGTPIWPRGEGDADCPTCRAYGYVEVREPFPLAERAQRFDLAYVFPGIPDRAGLISERPVSLTRLELHVYMDSLRAQVAQVKASVASGDWPATRGSHCDECPAKPQCPIPRELRTFAGVINTVEEAVEGMEQLDAEKDRHAARLKEIKNFTKTLPGQRLRFGRDQVLELDYRESERIDDRDGLFAAVERAVKYGEPFERARFVKPVKSTPMVQRRLTEAELADELGLAEGSNEEAA